ncbi:MAG: multidrug efflux RND transporter permease subunit [Gammaproteobacteria bacterium]|nr:multidrug efflux RND transporter permease subunit [Gammaproteobacteria bacterium]
MFSAFFIDRPKFAFVISIVITIAGLIALTALPVAQYPELAPPQVQVSATYPGADAETIADTVAGPLESKINGVDDMIYMSSNSANDGSYVLTVSFAVGTDPDIATVNVQNRVGQAEAMLPEEVRRQGVTTTKQSTNMLMVVNLFSPKQTYDNLFLSNYTNINVTDALARLDGVGKASILGVQDYGMRIWFDPAKLSGLELTPTDVITAIREQNVQVPAGQVGQAPATKETQFQYTLRTHGRMSDPEEFGEIIVRVDDDGSTVRVKDIARVELGSKTYSAYGNLEGEDAVILAIYQLPGANAMQVAEAVRNEMEHLSGRFPEDVEYSVLYDTTRLIEASINEVVTTLFIAIFLVVLVVFIFIQDWRSTLIPTIAIPVSLIGTFAGLMVMGYSINLITLFGLILAIGIVVDDAIIVVENTQRHLADGLSPRDATRKAMSEISGAIIATTLVLLAVFIPVGFMPGLTGQLYKQFSVTISIAVLISSINALTLSPALCASLLKPTSGLPDTGFFGWFNRIFEKVRGGYGSWVTVLVRRSALVMVLFVVFATATFWLFSKMPTGFVPIEDQGAFMIDIQLPEGASLNRTDGVVREAEAIVKQQPGVANVMSVAGYSILKQGVASNGALVIAVLDPWEERTAPELHEDAIVRQLHGKLNAIPTANIFPFQTPPIPGLGNTGGFEFILQSTSGDTPQTMASVMGGLIFGAKEAPELGAVFSTFKASVPQIFLDVDRDKAKLMGVSLTDLYATFSSQLGSAYVNDFNKFGKTYQVLTQADAQFRNGIEDVYNLHTRNATGEMVPMRTLLRAEPLLGPDMINRYNIYRSITVNGSAAPGYSSGDALAAMAQVAKEKLPSGYTFEWTGQAYQELLAGDSSSIILGLALLFVFLFLVAQYESWSIPISVMLAVPVAIFGAVVAQTLAGLNNDVYMQIGVVLLVGLASKNAILIVEFAKQLREEGNSIADSAFNAARLRFRAVLMTAFSFILGVIPLAVAVGAGAASRRSLGTAVLGGMIAAAILGTLLVPPFYAFVQGMRERIKGEPEPSPSPAGRGPG